MIQRLYQRFKVSSGRVWMIRGAMLGICALPCPECGTPLIFHVWPIAGLVLAARALKKRYQEKDPLISEIVLHEQKGLNTTVHHHEEHVMDEVVHINSDATIVDRAERLH